MHIQSIVTTELNSAAYNGDKDLLLALLKEHEVDECDEQGRTPLVRLLVPASKFKFLS